MTDDDSPRTRTPTFAEQAPHVRAALTSVADAQKDLSEARAALKRATNTRDQVLRDVWPLIRHMGPRGVQRATDVGESTVRNITRHLQGDDRG